jgi:hypothetical protein
MTALPDCGGKCIAYQGTARLGRRCSHPSLRVWRVSRSRIKSPLTIHRRRLNSTGSLLERLGEVPFRISTFPWRRLDSLLAGTLVCPSDHSHVPRRPVVSARNYAMFVAAPSSFRRMQCICCGVGANTCPHNVRRLSFCDASAWFKRSGMLHRVGAAQRVG